MSCCFLIFIILHASSRAISCFNDIYSEEGVSPHGTLPAAWGRFVRGSPKGKLELGHLISLAFNTVLIGLTTILNFNDSSELLTC